MHYKNDNFPDLLLVANESWLINVNEDLKDSFFNLKGMHGYYPENINMHGIFYAYGSRFKKDIFIDTFELIHIYPLLCEILGISSYKDIDGKLEILKSILK